MSLSMNKQSNSAMALSVTYVRHIRMNFPCERGYRAQVYTKHVNDTQRENGRIRERTNL